MYSHTKKVGSVGRYGPRIGRKIREGMKKIEDGAKRLNACPSCSKKRVVRKSSGVWKCSSCGITFTGGAYITRHEKKVLEDR